MGIFDSVFGKKEKNAKEKKQLPWIELVSQAQLEEIKENSKNKVQVIYKHSSTCGISRMVLNMFSESYDPELDIALYFLTIQNHRGVSNAIEEKFGVRHESPQLLVIKNEEVVAHASHGAISEIDLKGYL
nr:bacillithiol system redox-active protein YtxJ [Muricauda sp. UBA7809]